MAQVYSGFIEENQGIDGPVPFAGPAGWTVDKEGQTEVFVVRHGLSLEDPQRLRVIATTAKAHSLANVEAVTADEFRVSTWMVNEAAAMTALHFIAVLD